jgi:hypothetical protein
MCCHLLAHIYINFSHFFIYVHFTTFLLDLQSSMMNDHLCWKHINWCTCIFTATDDPDSRVRTQAVTLQPGTINDLHAHVKQCAVFLLGHNVEPDAVDLLEEPEIVDETMQLVDDNTYGCVCQCMVRFVT